MIKPFPIKPSTNKERMIKFGKNTVQLPPTTWKAGKVKCGYRVCWTNGDRFVIRFMSGIHWCFPIELYCYPNEEKLRERISLSYGSGGHHDGKNDPLQVVEVQASLFTKVAEIVDVLKRAF